MAQAVIGPVSRWHDSGIVGVGPGLWYGPTALDGAAGDWKRAPLGSIYVQVDAAGGTAQTWQKVAKNGATADWARVTSGAVAGGLTINGGTAANDDLILQGTSHATKTTSYVILQPTGGNVGVNTLTPASPFHVVAAGASEGVPTLLVGGPLFQNNDDFFSSAITILGSRVAASNVLFADADNQSAGVFAFDHVTDSFSLSVSTSKKLTLASTGTLKLAGVAARATTEGTNHIDIFNGTAPTGALTNGISIYSDAGAGHIMDALGNTHRFGSNLSVSANEALAGNTTDDYSAALTLDPAYTGDGIVTTVTLNAGGTGYTAADVITVVQAGGAGCTVTVNTVDGSGVITGITLLAGGTGYEVANALATTGGTGSGGKINITVLTARTVTRHNYIDVNQLALTKGAAVTGAALLRFDAAVGTHQALLTGTTKTTPTGVDAWIPINANGTIMYIPVYASTTA